MAALFIDLDGTLIHHGQNILLPGARDLLEKLHSAGHMIVLTTRRGNKEFLDHPVFSQEATEQLLSELHLTFDRILFDVPSPRIVINDDGCSAIQVETNKGVESLIQEREKK